MLNTRMARVTAQGVPRNLREEDLVGAFNRWAADHPGCRVAHVLPPVYLRSTGTHGTEGDAVSLAFLYEYEGEVDS